MTSACESDAQVISSRNTGQARRDETGLAHTSRGRGFVPITMHGARPHSLDRGKHVCSTELRMNVPDEPLLYRARASSRRKATGTSALSGGSLSWSPRGAPWRNKDKRQAPLSASLARISRHLFFSGRRLSLQLQAARYQHVQSVCRCFVGVSTRARPASASQERV